MKPIRLTTLLAAGTLLAAAAACGGDSGGSSPEAVAKKAMEAIVDEDVRTMCEITLQDGRPRTDDELDECVTEAQEAQEESKKALEDADQELREDVEKQTEEMKDIFRKALDEGPTNVGAEKDGQVVVTYELGGEESPITTQEVDGDWYVEASAS